MNNGYGDGKYSIFRIENKLIKSFLPEKIYGRGRTGVTQRDGNGKILTPTL